jgi:hypothetical protein
MRKFFIWYRSLRVKHQLILSFLIQWLYWFGAWSFYDAVWPSETKQTITEIIFKTCWMAFFMTLLFNWAKVKQLRKKKNG